MVVIKDQIQLHIGFNPVVMNQDTTAATRAFFSMMHISQYSEDFFYISKNISDYLDWHQAVCFLCKVANYEKNKVEAPGPYPHFGKPQPRLPSISFIHSENWFSKYVWICDLNYGILSLESKRHISMVITYIISVKIRF